MGIQLRQYLLPLGSRASALRRSLRAVARGVWGMAAMEDPLDGRFLPYYGFGKRNVRLIMDATNKCNLRCIMCHFALDESQRNPVVQWTTQDLNRLEREVLPFVRNATLSFGTEPLMWKGFDQLLDVVSRAKVPEVEMITNGLLLTDELAEKIVRSSMTRVQFSVDGATPETYESIRIKGTFDGFVQAIERMNAAKQRLNSVSPELQFNFTIMARNAGEMVELVRLAHRLGVRYLDFRHMVINDQLDVEHESMLFDRARANHELGRARELAAELGVEFRCCPEDFDLTDVDVQQSADVPSVDASSSTSMDAPAQNGATSISDIPDREPVPVEIADPGTQPAEPSAVELEPYAKSAASAARSEDYPQLETLPKNAVCDAPWRQFNIKPDQKVVPCCFWYTEEPLGDLARESYSEIWQGEGYRRLRWEILSGQLGPNCANCPVNGIGSLEEESAFHALQAAESQDAHQATENPVVRSI